MSMRRFLDPPYNVRIEGHAMSDRTPSRVRYGLGRDERGRVPLLPRRHAWRGSAFARATARSTLSAWTGDTWTASRRSGPTVYGELLNLCIWNKSNAGMGSLYRSKHELVFVYRVGTAPHLNMVELGRHGRNRTNVWDYASVNSMRGSRREDLALHPTVKPVGLVADAIQDVTRHGDLVLDLFLGSGTTLIAAERTGRRFRGLDIDPDMSMWRSSAGRREPASSPALKDNVMTFKSSSNGRPASLPAPAPKSQQTPVGSGRDTAAIPGDGRAGPPVPGDLGIRDLAGQDPDRHQGRQYPRDLDGGSAAAADLPGCACR